jgi:hypothetical protein
MLDQSFSTPPRDLAMNDVALRAANLPQYGRPRSSFASLGLLTMPQRALGGSLAAAARAEKAARQRTAVWQAAALVAVGCGSLATVLTLWFL